MVGFAQVRAKVYVPNPPYINNPEQKSKSNQRFG